MQAFYFFTLFATLLLSDKAVEADLATYSAVVVELYPVYNFSLDDETNIQNNAQHFVSIIETAAENFSANVIVFPEGGLTGFVFKSKYFLVPNPAENVMLCNSSAGYDPILEQLACAANASGAYVVVNLVEEFYNTTRQKTLYFNTDVVFDPNGIVIARYRKINLYGEGSLSASPDKELVYFDTDFGVRFGLLTCFDIIFKEPGVVLARDYNISHFIFPTWWFSQMPFLVGIQEQNYWAYTLDVVLLASEHNYPSVGSTGSGIYLGRQGPLAYRMTSVADTFLLHANIPVNYPYTEGTAEHSHSLKTVMEYLPSEKSNMSQTLLRKPEAVLTEELYLKRENLELYDTELIQLPEFTLTESKAKTLNATETVTIRLTLDKILCQNTLCCNFYLNITNVFKKSKDSITRGDDYSQLYYRLAVIDGIKKTENTTKGLQTCAIIPCVNKELSSCGMRSDSSSAETNSIYDLYQTDFVFESISITGNFSNNNSFVGPNVLLRGEEENYFGELLAPDSFVFNETVGLNNRTSRYVFKTLNSTRIVTASVYGRIFSRDGEPYSTTNSGAGGILKHHIPVLLLLVFLRMILVSILL